MSSRALLRPPGRRRAVAAVLVLTGAGIVAVEFIEPSLMARAAAPVSSGVDTASAESIRTAPTPVHRAAVAPAQGPRPDPSQPATATEPVVSLTAEALDGSRPTALRIPDVDISSPLIDLGLRPDRTLEVPSDFSVAGWFTRGPTPGEPGPAVIAGHVDSATGPAVFYRLAELQPGDEVLIDRQDGVTAQFAVDRVERYSKADFPTAEVYGWVDRAELRLITCGGEFDDSIGHYRDNVVVYARLVGTSRSQSDDTTRAP